MRAVPIIRSRTGCFTCRRRKKKCNEEKPICSGCKRNKLECNWPADLPGQGPDQGQGQGQGQSQTRERAQSTTSKSTSSTAATGDARSPQQGDAHQPVSPVLQRPQLAASPRGSIGSVVLLPNDSESPVARRFSHGSSDESSRASGGSGVNGDEMQDDDMENPVSPLSPLSPFGTLLGLDSDNTALQQRHPSDASSISAFDFISGRESFSGDTIYMHDNIPMNMSLLPSHGHDSFELLSYYLARTANSMGNGSTEINPFVAKLIPLAFSDPLVLHLILAQSAVHRQSSKECGSGGEVATRYYTDSLRMFRNLVGEYVAGKEDNNLVVTVGSLILCLTEV